VNHARTLPCRWPPGPLSGLGRRRRWRGGAGRAAGRAWWRM